MLATSTPSRLLSVAALLLAACGSRSDYELQYLRELVAQGKLQPALEQFERLPEAQRADPPTQQLLLGARLQALGFPPAGLEPMLQRVLSNPVRAYSFFQPGAFAEAHLRALIPQGWSAAREAPERAPRDTPDLNLVRGAGGLLAGLALTRSGAADGPTVTLNSLEFLAGADGAVATGLPGAARALLRGLDVARGKESRVAALPKFLTGELEP